MEIKYKRILTNLETNYHIHRVLKHRMQNNFCKSKKAIYTNLQILGF